VREHHGKDESYFPYALPDAVVFAHSTEEVPTSSTSAGAIACR